MKKLLFMLMLASCSTTNEFPPTFGRVVVLMDVNKDGTTQNIRIVESDPPDYFDQEAIKAAKKWRYHPGDGKKDHRLVIEFKATPEEESRTLEKEQPGN
jgi:TonB family protein